MKSLLIPVLVLSSIAQLCTLCLQPMVRPAGAAPPPGYALDWSDDFNGTQLDQNKWTIQTGPDKGAECVTDAVRVLGGQLVLSTYTSGTPPTQKTGVVHTKNKYAPLYGYFEASIEFPSASGLFSTFWLWSNNMNVAPFNQPHTQGTEMDIAEHSMLIGQQNVQSKASSTLHWDGYGAYHKVAGGDLHSGVGDLSVGFHTYGLEWAPTFEKFYFDGNLVWTIFDDSQTDPPSPSGCAYPPCTPGLPQSPSVFAPVSHTNQFIDLSSEVGDPPCWCGPIPQGGYGNPFETTMSVDYVRHYFLDTAPPANVVDLCLGSASTSSILVTWTAPTDNSGSLAQYDLRRSTYPITAQNFSGATPVTGVPAPHSPGTAESYTVTGLGPCTTTYYFAIKTKDTVGNWSAISNVPSGTTRCSSISPAGRIEQAATICSPGAAKNPIAAGEGSPSFSAPSPNPASAGTGFLISVPSGYQGAKLRVDVFDVGGRRVRSLVDGTASQGTAPIEWNLLNDSGQRVASGLYMVRVNLGDTQKSLPLLVIR